MLTVRSIRRADNRGQERERLFDGCVAAGLAHGFLDRALRATHDDTVRPVADRLAVARTEDRVARLVAEHDVDAEAVRRQRAVRAERIDRIRFDVHRLRLDVAGREQRRDELVAGRMAIERVVERFRRRRAGGGEHEQRRAEGWLENVVFHARLQVVHTYYRVFQQVPCARWTMDARPRGRDG